MRTSQEVKNAFFRLGADLCEIASVDRFSSAPEGFHPRDVLPDAQSVIAIAKRFPAGTLRCATTVPYTIIRNHLSVEMDRITCEFYMEMDRDGVAAVPTGAIGPTEFDPHTGRSRNILSAKHAAQAAGLGVIGRNTLLITPEYGNMVWLAAVVCELPLEPDPLMDTDFCGNCRLCAEACPVHAVGEPAIRQSDCAAYAFGGVNGGEWKIKCYRCREVCPHCLGSKNDSLSPRKMPVA